MCSTHRVTFRPRAGAFAVFTAVAIVAGRMAAAPREAPGAAAAPPAIETAIEITYIANEGFLISGANRKVLIDGIFTEGFGRFESPSAEVLRQERDALPPFDHVDALLVTHYHPDHINPADVVRHLANDPQAVLIGPPQVGDLLQAVDGAAGIARQIRVVSPRPGEIAGSSVRDFRVKSMVLPHLNDAEGKHQNLGFLLHLGGFTLLHVGDAGVGAPALFEELKLAGENIDIAFLNCYWFDDGNLATARKVIAYLKPKAILLMHQGAKQAGHYRELLGKQPDLPPVYLADSPMQTMRYRLHGGVLVTDLRPAGGRP
ncbi:MAG TPA: MBL fold metallo-hydrolase [Opitutaceae bacterium]|nr:MBL fold metallo-hydrolase [Opitutaceae bacterium]